MCNKNVRVKRNTLLVAQSHAKCERTAPKLTNCLLTTTNSTIITINKRYVFFGFKFTMSLKFFNLFCVVAAFMIGFVVNLILVSIKVCVRFYKLSLFFYLFGSNHIINNIRCIYTASVEP